MSALLDTFITMAFVYTLLSVLVTFITETWQRLQKSRGKLLKRAMIRLLNDSLNKNFAELLYEHPLVRGMRVDDKHLPSYISTPVFIDAFLDILRREAGEPQVYMTTDGQMHVAELPQKDAYQSVKDGIMAMAHSPLRFQICTCYLVSRISGWYYCTIQGQGKNKNVRCWCVCHFYHQR
jgi:hypothetical protein